MRDPDRKGKVESGVGHAKKTPLKGMRFESLEEAQAHLDRWEERWADTRIHGTTKRQVSAMFAEEKPALLPLPLNPFATTNTVNGRCIWMAAWKWKPPITARHLAGSAAACDVQWNTTQVRLIDPHTGQLLREHLRQQRGRHRIQEKDRPSRTPLGTEQLLVEPKTPDFTSDALCQAHAIGSKARWPFARILGWPHLVEVRRCLHR